MTLRCDVAEVNGQRLSRGTSPRRQSENDFIVAGPSQAGNKDVESN